MYTLSSNSATKSLTNKNNMADMYLQRTLCQVERQRKTTLTHLDRDRRDTVEFLQKVCQNHNDRVLVERSATDVEIQSSFTLSGNISVNKVSPVLQRRKPAYIVHREGWGQEILPRPHTSRASTQTFTDSGIHERNFSPSIRSSNSMTQNARDGMFLLQGKERENTIEERVKVFLDKLQPHVQNEKRKYFSRNMFATNSRFRHL